MAKRFLLYAIICILISGCIVLVLLFNNRKEKDEFKDQTSHIDSNPISVSQLKETLNDYSDVNNKVLRSNNNQHQPSDSLELYQNRIMQYLKNKLYEPAVKNMNPLSELVMSPDVLRSDKLTIIWDLVNRNGEAEATLILLDYLELLSPIELTAELIYFFQENRENAKLQLKMIEVLRSSMGMSHPEIHDKETLQFINSQENLIIELFTELLSTSENDEVVKRIVKSYPAIARANSLVPFFNDVLTKNYLNSVLSPNEKISLMFECLISNESNQAQLFSSFFNYIEDADEPQKVFLDDQLYSLIKNSDISYLDYDFKMAIMNYLIGREPEFNPSDTDPSSVDVVDIINYQNWLMSIRDLSSHNEGKSKEFIRGMLVDNKSILKKAIIINTFGPNLRGNTDYGDYDAILSEIMDKYDSCEYTAYLQNVLRDAIVTLRSIM